MNMLNNPDWQNMMDGGGDADFNVSYEASGTVQELKNELEKKITENKELKQLIDEKDKKIKELNIRLTARERRQSHIPGIQDMMKDVNQSIQLATPTVPEEGVNEEALREREN